VIQVPLQMVGGLGGVQARISARYIEYCLEYILFWQHSYFLYHSDAQSTNLRESGAAEQSSALNKKHEVTKKKLKLKDVLEYLNARERLHDWKRSKERRLRKREYKYIRNPILTKSLRQAFL